MAMRRPSTRLAKRPPSVTRVVEVVPNEPPASEIVAAAPMAVAGHAHHILIADGRLSVIADLSYHLARAGYRVSSVLTGSEATIALRLQPPTLLLVGDGLPGIPGAELVRRLRGAIDGREIAAMMLLAPDADADARVDALALGADDCLAWPGDVRELVLRVSAVTRRYARVRPQLDETVRSGDLVVDAGRAEVTVAGTSVHFTRTEFDLLWILVKHPRQLFTRDQLLTLTRGDAAVLYAPRRIDRHMALLRAKLGPLGGCLETITGKGYRFIPPAHAEP